MKKKGKTQQKAKKDSLIMIISNRFKRNHNHNHT